MNHICDQCKIMEIVILYNTYANLRKKLCKLTTEVYTQHNTFTKSL